MHYSPSRVQQTVNGTAPILNEPDLRASSFGNRCLPCLPSSGELDRSADRKTEFVVCAPLIDRDFDEPV